MVTFCLFSCVKCSTSIAGTDASIPRYGHERNWEINTTWARTQSMPRKGENTLASFSFCLGTWNLFSITKSINENCSRSSKKEMESKSKICLGSSPPCLSLQFSIPSCFSLACRYQDKVSHTMKHLPKIQNTDIQSHINCELQMILLIQEPKFYLCYVFLLS